MRYDIEQLKDLTGTINEEVRVHVEAATTSEKFQAQIGSGLGAQADTLVSTFQRRDNLEEDTEEMSRHLGRVDDEIDDLRRE